MLVYSFYLFAAGAAAFFSLTAHSCMELAKLPCARGRARLTAPNDAHTFKHQCPVCVEVDAGCPCEPSSN